MQPSPALADFVRAWEGCVLVPYADSAGFMTVGIGHKMSPRALREPITQAQADALFEQDLAARFLGVSLYVTDAATQQQMDAVTSLAFNAGTVAIRDSTLVKKLNAGDIVGAAMEFEKWCHAGGEVIDGLHKRRLAEREIFLNGDYSGRP